MIDGVLHNALDRGILLCEKGKLVDDQDGLLLPGSSAFAEISEGLLPIQKRREEIVVKIFLHSLGKVAQVQCVVLFLRREKDAGVPLGKLLQDRRLSYTTPAVHDEKLEAVGGKHAL